MSDRILALADELAGMGVKVDKLRPLQKELDLVERPGALRRLSKKAMKVARRQWDHAIGEMRESRDMFVMLTRRAATNKKLSPEEADHVRNQPADLLRLVPATMIVATNQVLPLPGTSLLTPMILRRLGLLPSRWREAHLLHELDSEAQRLHQIGRHKAAERVEALQHELEEEADAREAAALEADLLTHWDANHNGVLDPEELEAYGVEVERVKRKAGRHAHRKRWYLFADGGVVGPVRLSELGAVTGVLVCFDGRTGWVSLSDLRAV